MSSVLVTKSEIQACQHLCKSTCRNNFKTRSTDSLFGVWYATLFNIATQFKLNLPSIGDICAARLGVRGSNHVLARLPFLLPGASKAPGVLVQVYALILGRNLRSAFLTSPQVIPPAPPRATLNVTMFSPISINGFYRQGLREQGELRADRCSRSR